MVAGYPVIEICVTVYDGKAHPGNSKEIAFVTAVRKATTEGTATVFGLAPLYELGHYAARFKAIAAGSGEFSYAFAQYAAAPQSIQQQLMSTHQRHEDDD